MDFKRSALAKAGDKLIKALELADSFKKRKENLSQDYNCCNDYNTKVYLLKQALSEEYKRCIENSRASGLFAMKRDVVEKHIQFVRSIQNKKTLNENEKKIIDTLISKYT
jgi:tryptophanyl-tRNA synthetase